MSIKWVPIRYRDFYDFPRAFVVEKSGDLLFFDCPFNDGLDDYEADFTVFKISDEFRDKVDDPSWKDLRRHATRVGRVPTKAIRFDETKRQAVDSEVFDLVDERSSPTD